MNSKDNSLEVVEIKLLLTTEQITAIYKSLSAAKAAATAFIQMPKDICNGPVNPMINVLLGMPDLPDELREMIEVTATEVHEASIKEAAGEAKAFNNILSQFDVQLRAYDLTIPHFDFDKEAVAHNMQRANEQTEQLRRMRGEV